MEVEDVDVSGDRMEDLEDPLSMSRVAKTKRVAVIVAHPDDELIWAGGTLLDHPEWSTFIITLCRANDLDRAPRFFRVLRALGASGGSMADLDDDPVQRPLPLGEVKEAICSQLPHRNYDLIITHSPHGEYTRHIRHEEAFNAVWALLQQKILRTKELWVFAYEDGGGRYLPRAEALATNRAMLSHGTWERKRRILQEVYNFADSSWEVRAAPREEAFQSLDPTVQEAEERSELAVQ